MQQEQKLVEGVKISLKTPDDFLKIKESLTRMGIASGKGNTLYQSCHILHKRGEYYIVHFKSLFALDGKETDISTEDIQRRNAIAFLLHSWGLCTIIDLASVSDRTPPAPIKVIKFSEKGDWKLVPKYSLGAK